MLPSSDFMGWYARTVKKCEHAISEEWTLRTGRNLYILAGLTPKTSPSTWLII
jgi:hypothetical protein